VGLGMTRKPVIERVIILNHSVAGRLVGFFEDIPERNDATSVTHYAKANRVASALAGQARARFRISQVA